ncbi:type I-C CRISPR-associated protein Cas8c/Csd1 [Enterococcus sp. UD-01]|uniref:type I-C CRISPR-associated protein Cas8c/Csd1 n=1 Tax=Enterococcus sp. UD-01 TaxID=3373911 RepID=UPI003838CEEB
MTWLYDLYQTYEENKKKMGEVEESIFGKKVLFLPEAHTYQNAQYEISISPEGEFVRAEVISKDDQATIIPVTIESENRTSNPVSHMLHDKLQYVAGDYEEYGGCYSGNKNYYKDYIQQLKTWCSSQETHPRVQSILNYVEKGSVIKDLIETKLINPKKIPLDSVIRFNVLDGDVPVWEDKNIMNNYINFYMPNLKNRELDYITGEYSLLYDKHASIIGKKKLISENQKQPFAFLGRFSDISQVVSVGYEVSTKGHNALKWLIKKQGRIIDSRIFLTWSQRGSKVPFPEESTYSIFARDLQAEKLVSRDLTNQRFAKLVSNVMNGLKANLGVNNHIFVLILDAATTGRMAILYYQSIDTKRYFDQLMEWQTSCIWRHKYGVEKGKDWIGSPSLSDMVEAAYGEKASNVLIKNTLSELYPCVLEGKKIPLTIVRRLFQRASNPAGIKDENEWEKVLSIACAAMIRHRYDQTSIEQKEKFKGDIQLELNQEENDRSYLFGRLLAVADYVEEKKLKQLKENRPTNAKKYMQKFSSKPKFTWKMIRESLVPYETRMLNQGRKYTEIIDEQIMPLFLEGKFNDDPLDGRYLEGYANQRVALVELDKEDKKNK